MLPHRFAATAAALAVVIAVAVAASPAARHVLSQRDAAPAGWSTIRPASPTARVHFQVAMQQSNLDRLEATLAEVSDPNHARYGKYLTSAQVQALTATPRESARVVEAAFRGFDCHSLGDSLRCAGVVADVERMFGVTMHVFRHDATGVYRRGTLGVFSVDASLRDHVVFVDGLSNFFEPKRVKKPQPVTAGEDYVIIPETLRTLYNITDQVGSADVIQAAAEFGAADYNFSYTDLALFSKSVGVPIDIVNIIGEGANDPGQFSIEATLDVQYVGAIGRGNTNWFVKTPEWMYTFATHLVNTTKRPGVISMSYGWNEQKNCNIADGECRQLDVKVAQYIARVNTEFQKVGTLGTTLLASSGDSGCHGRTDKICLFNAKMYPAFPAASPFVTAVGGTMLKGGGNGPANSSIPICTSSGCATGGQEVVCTTENHQAEITSGGGFSAFAPRPQWQDAVVSKYLANTSAVPSSSIFNTQGRGYPDVAALAHKYFIAVEGRDGTVDGTSASCPTVAGIVGLINAHRLKNNRPAVGFLNPLLYQIHNETAGAAFNDIVEGSNRCTEGGCLCRTGFEAAPGWDASTGLGTPNLGRMLAALDVIDARREAAIARKQ